MKARDNEDLRALDSRLDTIIALLSLIARGISEQDEQIGALSAQGLNSKQISDILGVNPVTIRTTLHRQRKRRG